MLVSWTFVRSAQPQSASMLFSNTVTFFVDCLRRHDSTWALIGWAHLSVRGWRNSNMSNMLSVDFFPETRRHENYRRWVAHRSDTIREDQRRVDHLPVRGGLVWHTPANRWRCVKQVCNVGRVWTVRSCRELPPHAVASKTVLADMPRELMTHEWSICANTSQNGCCAFSCYCWSFYLFEGDPAVGFWT